MPPENKPAVQNAVEEEHVEETPQGSWDALDAEFEEGDGANFSEAPEVETEPAVAEDAPPEVEEEDAPEPDASEVQPEAEAKPADPEPAEEPAPESEAEVAPEAKTEEVASAEETPAEPPPQVQAQPQLTPEQRQELRGQAKRDLASRYVLSEEEAEAWDLNPREALPNLAAELHLQVYESVVDAVMRQIPTVVEATQISRSASQGREERFYKRWPELKKFGPQTAQMAYMWAQMNPGATEEKAREEIGKIATAALGLGPAQAEVPASPPPAAPMTPPATAPVQRATKPNANPFSALADEWAKEEEIE